MKFQEVLVLVFSALPSAAQIPSSGLYYSSTPIYQPYIPSVPSTSTYIPYVSPPATNFMPYMPSIPPAPAARFTTASYPLLPYVPSISSARVASTYTTSYPLMPYVPSTTTYSAPITTTTYPLLPYVPSTPVTTVYTPAPAATIYTPPTTILPAPISTALTVVPATSTAVATVACNTQKNLDLIRCYGILSGCYITQCTSEGAYVPKQCGVFPCAAPNIGQPCPQCWCVDFAGVEIAGSRADAANAPVCGAIAVTTTVATPVTPVYEVVRTRTRIPVRRNDGNNNLIVCALRPSLCFGGGSGGGGSGMPL